MASITFNKKEVTNPVARYSLVVLLYSVMFFSLPLHLVLRMCGRRGFSTDEAYEISAAGFRKKDV